MNYRDPQMTPPISATPGRQGQPPPGATHAYFYSGKQATRSGQYVLQGGTGRPDLPYTQDVALDLPGAEQRIASYLKEFPDARLAAFGTGNDRVIPAPASAGKAAAPFAQLLRP